MNVDSETSGLLDQIRRRLSAAFGVRFHGAVLFGSEARGNATADSDIDIAILLRGPVDSWADFRHASEAVYPLILSSGRLIDAIPVDNADYERSEAPLYMDARREGIRL